VPIFTWTGCYIGGHVGGGFGRKDFSDTPTHGFVGGTSAPQSIQEDTSGFLGGGQVGCDYQFAPNWLVGIQGSGSGADIKGDDPFFTYAKHFRARTDWLANVTGRIGWTWDRWMIYGKGGVAWAGDKYDGDEPGFIFYASERRTLSWVSASNGPSGTIGRRSSNTTSMVSALEQLNMLSVAALAILTIPTHSRISSRTSTW